MIAFMFELDHIEPDSDGWESFFKSDDVFNALDDKCEAVADAANAASSPDKMSNLPFYGRASYGDKTALGFVGAATPHGYNAWERIIDNLGAGG